MKKHQKVLCIILASGESHRFTNGAKYGIKKQWLRVDGIALWRLLGERFKAIFDDMDIEYHIAITASKSDFLYMSKHNAFDTILGGETRQDSLLNALNAYENYDIALVHDCARMDINPTHIKNMLDYAMKEIASEHTSNITPYISVSDTALYNDKYINREDIKLIQTPQISNFVELKNAINQAKDKNQSYTDESSLLNAMGKKVTYYPGDKKTHKITYIDDISSMRQNSDIYVGSGFDTHAFEINTGKKMMLCGIEIPCERHGDKYAFKAHSDGDVGIHALCDAILGAINGGDIGEWYPDTDDMYKNANSKNLLKEIYDFARSVGFTLINADITLLAQIPKISPYKSQMIESIAKTMDIHKSKISLKATTMESMGFVGREEGICAMASVSMKMMELDI